MSTILTWAVGATAIAAGATAGALLAFSSFAMQGIREQPPQRSVAVMQAVNRRAPRGLFMVPFMGAASGAVGIGSYAVLVASTPHRWLLVAGCAAYLLCFVITAGFHVPRNDALARVDVDGPDAAEAWEGYVGPWVRMNHVRVLAALAGAAGLVAALALG